MKSILALLLSALAVSAQTNTVDITWNWYDFQLNPQAVRRITMTPLPDPFADYAGGLISLSPKSAVTGLYGSYTYSNTVPGYCYRIQLDTPYGSTVRTCGIPATVSGPINGRDYLGMRIGPNFFYLYQTNGGQTALQVQAAVLQASNSLAGQIAGISSPTNGLTSNQVASVVEVVALPIAQAVAATNLPSGVVTNGQTNVTISGTFHGQADSAGSASEATNAQRPEIVSELAQAVLGIDGNEHFTVTGVDWMITNLFSWMSLISQAGNNVNVTGGMQVSNIFSTWGTNTYNGNSVFNGSANFNNGVSLTGAGYFSGDAFGLTNLQASQLTGSASEATNAQTLGGVPASAYAQTNGATLNNVTIASGNLGTISVTNLVMPLVLRDQGSLQAFINAVAAGANNSHTLHIPAGLWHATNIALPASCLGTASIAGAPWTIEGEGQQQTFIATMATNGFIFGFQTSGGGGGPRVVGVTIKDLCLLGPGVTNIANGAGATGIYETTNYSTVGIFVGITNAYASDTCGYQIKVQKCAAFGFRSAVEFSNTVTSAVEDCIFEGNWQSDIHADKCDTFKVSGGNYGWSSFPMTITNFHKAAMWFTGGGLGAVVTSCEIGGVWRGIFNDGGEWNLVVMGGNTESIYNEKFLQKGAIMTTFIGPMDNFTLTTGVAYNVTNITGGGLGGLLVVNPVGPNCTGTSYEFGVTGTAQVCYVNVMAYGTVNSPNCLNNGTPTVLSPRGLSSSEAIGQLQVTKLGVGVAAVTPFDVEVSSFERMLFQSHQASPLPAWGTPLTPMATAVSLRSFSGDLSANEGINIDSPRLTTDGDFYIRSNLVFNGTAMGLTNSALARVPAGYDSIQFYSNHVWRVTPTATNLIN